MTYCPQHLLLYKTLGKMLEFPLAVKYKSFKVSLRKTTDGLSLEHIITAFTVTGINTMLVTLTGQLHSRTSTWLLCQIC